MEPALADNLMRLIAEGAGEDDESADAELRAQAVSSYLSLLEKPKLPDILLQVNATKLSSSQQQHYKEVKGCIKRVAVASKSSDIL